MRNFLKKRWVYHSISWGIVILCLSIRTCEGEELLSLRNIAFVTWISLPVIIFTYGFLYLKSRFWKEKKYGKFMIGWVIVALVAVFLDNIESFLQHGELSIITTLRDYLIFLLIALAIQYVKRAIVNYIHYQEIESQRREAELYVLRMQLNPHFIFNTLNNIYSVLQFDNKKGSDMVLELADTMRYHLQFSNQKVVDIEDEFRLIQSYIELEKLRLNDNCKLDISLEQRNSSQTIAPLILLTFIENAFKYGTHPIKPCFIKIAACIENGTLRFTCQNSIFNNKKVIKTNIGIDNTQKRLALLYQERHQLDISRTEGVFSVKLMIDL